MRCSTAVALAFLAATSTLAAETAPPTPAERRIAAARRAIEREPQSGRAHSALALALGRRARETADPSLYRRGLEAVETALRLAPGDFEALRARAWLLLGQHDFARALEEAAALERRAPDDLVTYGLLADAHAELGHYREAEEAVQWMLDLRPGNVPALTRAATLRELFGDVEGALDGMRQAFARLAPSEVEDAAWVSTQLAHLHLARGETALASRWLDRALALFPDYPHALAEVGKARLQDGQPAAAVAALRRRWEVAPHAESLYDLAVALLAADRRQEAQDAFREFEAGARAQSGNSENSNRRLIHYYAGEAARPGEALRLAELEIARRRDVFTLDAYAWALAANGRLDEARRAIDEALGVGIRDAEILFHAGLIARRQGDETTARGWLEASLAANPRSPVAPAAREALAASPVPISWARRRRPAGRRWASAAPGGEAAGWASASGA